MVREVFLSRFSTHSGGSLQDGIGPYLMRGVVGLFGVRVALRFFGLKTGVPVRPFGFHTMVVAQLGLWFRLPWSQFNSRPLCSFSSFCFVTQPLNFGLTGFRLEFASGVRAVFPSRFHTHSGESWISFDHWFQVCPTGRFVTELI